MTGGRSYTSMHEDQLPRRASTYSSYGHVMTRAMYTGPSQLGYGAFPHLSPLLGI